MTVTRAKGDVIFRQLREVGEKPVRLEASPANIYISFELISDAPTWIKGFGVDAQAAEPGAFLVALDAWKEKVRRDIALGSPSAVVRQMIAHHGFKAVMEALK